MENINTHTPQVAVSQHISSYKLLFTVFAGLILLTILTVLVSTTFTFSVSLAVALALMIASTKALLVAYYFMHLKYEPRFYKWMVIVVLALFTFFVIMLTIDYFTR